MNSLPQITATLLSGTTPARLKSLQSLVELSSRNHDGDREKIMSQVQDHLLNLLRCQEMPIVEKTVECIRYLARNNSNKVALEKVGVIEPLKDLLHSKSEKTKASAAGALWSLAVNPDNKIKIGASGAIPSLIQILRTGSPEAKTTAAGAIWNLSVNNQLEVEIVKLGAIEPLVDLLQTGLNDGKNRAAQALSNLCYNPQHKVLAAKAGAIPPLIEVLKTGSQDARTNACSALWNIAVNLQNKTTIAQSGGIEALVTVLQEGTIDAQINAAAALATLTINHDENQNKIDSLFVLEEIVRVLTRKPEFNADMCTALNNFTKNSRNVDVVINFGLENILKALQKEKNKTNHERLCGCLRNLTLSDSGKKTLVQHGVIEAFVDTLSGEMESSKDEAAAGLYNLALDPQIVPQILEKGAKPALENTQASSSNKQAQIRASSVLRLLRQVEASPVQHRADSRPIITQGGTENKLVTISYSPPDQRVVIRIARVLSDLGLSVSLESTDSRSPPDLNSHVLLICLSRNYSNFCGRAIAQEFHQARKPLIGLTLDSVQPSGWVVAMLGSHLFDLSSGNNFFLGLNEVARFVRHEVQVRLPHSVTKHVSRDEWLKWSATEVGDWLKIYELTNYTEKFIEEGIDGVALDQMIDLWKTKQDLTLEGLLNEMGVTTLGDPNKFWAAIQELVCGNYYVRETPRNRA